MGGGSSSSSTTQKVNETNNYDDKRIAVEADKSIVATEGARVVDNAPELFEAAEAIFKDVGVSYRDFVDLGERQTEGAFDLVRDLNEGLGQTVKAFGEDQAEGTRQLVQAIATDAADARASETQAILETLGKGGVVLAALIAIGIIAINRKK